MRVITVKAHSQSGQAMVEFIVAMTMVMSVLLLAIVMLGKFNDVRNRAQMSSRYITWERTVWTDGDMKKDLASDPTTAEGWSSAYGASALAVSKTDAELKGEVMERVMTSDNALISAKDRGEVQLAAVMPAMWKDYGGNALVASEAAVTVETRSSAAPASANDSTALSKWSIPAVDAEPLKTQLNLPTRTLQAGTVSISVGQNNSVLKRLWPKTDTTPAFSGLTFSDTNVLISNTWVPEGTDSNKAVFSNALAAANATVVPSAGYLGLQKYAPEISTLEFGRVRQDVVPTTRLK